MFRIPLISSFNSISSRNKFWESVILYHNRPHLVNRKISFISENKIFRIIFHSGNNVTLEDLLNRSAILYELRQLNCNEELDQNFITSLLFSYDKNVKIIESTLEEMLLIEEGFYLSTRFLFPRMKNNPNAVEVILFNMENNRARFLAVSDSDKHFIAPTIPYEIELTTDFNLKLNLNCFEDADSTHALWLSDQLFPKLLKWMENETKPSIKSLSLIKERDYSYTYNKLKELYAENLISEWPERSGTDPQKYVFEDIAIASYLICLWKNETEEINFVDCGCGNGLLVYLLNQEGFKGFGVDVRKRKIWEMYPTTTDLKIDTINENTIFSTCNWIIGNHSDELTPWVPIIALNSRANFFLLPCCSYDFNGQKFLRTNHKISVYADYMKYIKYVSEKCKFDVKLDRLRIPSTKRNCLVGCRNESGVNIEEIFKSVDEELIKPKTGKGIIQRSDKIIVKNCTQLDKTIISDIVKLVVDKILECEQHDTKSNGDLWNRGGEFKLSDLVLKIPKNLLKELKEECGGLQTLLKNHRYIFKISKRGVSLNPPMNITETIKYKEKPCWFLKNHPNGCLFDNKNCAYLHG